MSFIIGMISAMKNLLYRFSILTIIIGLEISACSPMEYSKSVPPTPTTAMVKPTLISTLLPTNIAVNMDVQPDEIPEGISIKFWHPWSGETANLMAEMADEFNESNEWGITINAEFHSDETVFIGDMNRVIEEGNSPELIAAPGYYLRSLETSGFVLQDLQKFIDSPNWGLLNDEVESFLPIFWNADVVSGKRIGIPAYESGYFIFFNQTWAKELGFSKLPSDLEGFRDRTCEAGSAYLNDSDLTNNGTGGWVYSYNPLNFYSWLKAFRGSNETVIDNSNSLGSIENIESGTYLYDLFLDNCAWIGRQQQPHEYFANRQAVAYSGKMEDILIQERVNELNKSSDQWSVIPYPSKTDRPVLLVDGDSFAITTQDSEKALAVWVFVRWLLSPENQSRIIEVSGTFPLSDAAMDLLKNYEEMHPNWAEALDYLPLVEMVPDDPIWGLTKEVLTDVSWKLIQFNTKREDIPMIFQDAQNLLSEIAR
jgi:ABC-type glycerol-3-phosphate transport system substrate-binding protein